MIPRVNEPLKKHFNIVEKVYWYNLYEGQVVVLIEI